MIFMRRYLAFTYHGECENFCAICPDFPGLVLIDATRDGALRLLEAAIEPLADGDTPACDTAEVPDNYWAGVLVHLIIVEVEEV